MIPRPSYRFKDPQQLNYKVHRPISVASFSKELDSTIPSRRSRHPPRSSKSFPIPSVNEPSPQSSRESNEPSIDCTRLQPRKLTAKRVDGPTGVPTRSLPISTGLASRFSLLILLLSLSSRSLNQEQELVMKERKRRTRPDFKRNENRREENRQR